MSILIALLTLWINFDSKFDVDNEFHDIEKQTPSEKLSIGNFMEKWSR